MQLATEVLVPYVALEVRRLTSNGDIVVAVLDAGATAAIVEGIVAVEVYERSTLAKAAKALAVSIVSGLGAVGVDPELGRASIKVDGDALGRAADFKVQGVKVSSLAVRELALLLALLVLGRSASVGAERESEQASSFNEAIVVDKLEGLGGQRQSRQRKETETHDYRVNECRRKE